MNTTRLSISSVLAGVLLIFVACGGGSDATDTPTSSAAPTNSERTTSPTPTDSVTNAISAAYLRYWDGYSDAVFNLDETHLTDVMTDPQLTRTQQEIAGLRQRGRAAKIVVTHNFFVASVDSNAGTATIYDEYTNSSYEVDAATHEEVGAPPSPATISDTYYLVYDGGVWKVSDGVRQGS